jgi:hypothetical protein
VEQPAIDRHYSEHAPENHFIHLEDAAGDPLDAEQVEERGRVLDERERIVELVREAAVRVVLALHELRHKVAERRVLGGQ